jgi:hypothetical protein
LSIRTALAPTYPATSSTPLRMKGRGLHRREERNSWVLELGVSRFMASSVGVSTSEGDCSDGARRGLPEFRALGAAEHCRGLLRK